MHSHTSSLDSLGSLSGTLLPNGAARGGRAAAGSASGPGGAYPPGARSIPSARRSYPPAEGSYRSQVQSLCHCLYGLGKLRSACYQIEALAVSTLPEHAAIRVPDAASFLLRAVIAA